MTSELKLHNIRAPCGDGLYRNGCSRRRVLQKKRNSSSTLPISTTAWEEDLVVDYHATSKSKSRSIRQSSPRRTSWEMVSSSVLAMMDDVVSNLKDEELPIGEDHQGRRRSIGSDVAARVSEIVEDNVEFHKLQAEMRATGMSTGAGAIQHIVRLDQ